MDLQPYVDAVRHELGVAAAAGGAEAEALAQRLTAPLESALRLALLEALSEAAEQITRELAPGSVHVRLSGRDPEFTVEPAETDADGPVVPPVVDVAESDLAPRVRDDDGGTWRVSLRLPESLRTGVEGAARHDGVSVNAWLVRSAAAALGGAGRQTRAAGKTFSGWVR
ncbi:MULTISPECIES: histidine kinase [unclassified Mycolicibacterium]|uniref:histidine kinase n=1 Tax=unclassified Mycolicibacterium TaxID=2636767 RepID=UPI0012DCF384|nr:MULTISPECIES: histidine kinase [unclassified Mycolicibacterium]MUL80438.1 histidine kinase [Mycolicibacterium sp. CBMA 329]MUL86205.1 histidine kinase [Mycolicibacterium sp. CBMA 331]MUM01132.1 histidine kinase [Mycolicibacterium sp. CBMA 334]MUM25026.1 histidine kinase [Mycolicibacterium sp. CBMA 295]MUM36501.1 histidine kinase [Mycolicibacterium sp. CBMA 247]